MELKDILYTKTCAKNIRVRTTKLHTKFYHKRTSVYTKVIQKN